MGTALGVLLLAVGAVLAFAVDATVTNVDLFLVGSILMLVGAACIAMSMMRWSPRRRTAYVPYETSQRVRETV
jgi:uncharacterized membrane protein YidH (DUF202 family)